MYHAESRARPASLALGYRLHFLDDAIAFAIGHTVDVVNDGLAALIDHIEMHFGDRVL
ncbi:hypothetical protein D3C87_2158700 [compost metagenome]